MSCAGTHRPIRATRTVSLARQPSCNAGGGMSLLPPRRPHLVRVATLLTCIASVSLAGPADASTLKVRTDAEAIAAADRIVRGRVEAVRTERRAGSGAIETVASIRIVEDYSGGADRVIEIREIGGTIGSTTLAIPGAARFIVGDDILALVERRGGGAEAMHLPVSGDELARHVSLLFLDRALLAEPSGLGKAGAARASATRCMMLAARRVATSHISPWPIDRRRSARVRPPVVPEARLRRDGGRAVARPPGRSRPIADFGDIRWPHALRLRRRASGPRGAPPAPRQDACRGEIRAAQAGPARDMDRRSFRACVVSTGRKCRLEKLNVFNFIATVRTSDAARTHIPLASKRRVPACGNARGGRLPPRALRLPRQGA